MRVVAAVNQWPGDDVLDPRAAALAVGETWLEAQPAAEVHTVPLGDGGPRTADAWPGERGLVGGAEVVQYRGLRWLAPSDGVTRWNPMDLSTALLGLAAIQSSGPVVIPVGDDAPAGDAAALWGDALPVIRDALRPLELVVMVTSSRPLLGFHGMSASLMVGREADQALAAAAQEQERHWIEMAREGDATAARDALIGPVRMSDLSGTGAAGGLAYVLAALGARIVPAAHYLVDASGLATVAERADLLVGVGGDLTPATLDNGVAASVAAVAGRRAVPATVLSTGVHVGRRDLMAAGLSSAHEAARGPRGLTDGITRIAHTWRAP